MTAPAVEAILDKALGGGRIGDDEAATLLHDGDLLALGRTAHALRLRRADPATVTYIIDRNVNYTNVCTSGCRFCAFYVTDGDPEGYVISDEEMDRKIEETQALGGNQILLQGGLHPSLPLEWYEQLLTRIKERHGIRIHAFSGPEIVHIAGLSGLSVADTVARLHAAGLDSIPGGGAEILVDRVRSLISPHKCSAAQWIEVMRAAHRLGMRSTATMMFGHEESLEERIESMGRIRDLQDETGGFTAFICWPFQPDHTALSGIGKTGAHGYLKMLAVARIYLDNVAHLQASWVTQGAKVAQTSLFFGADDFGSLMIEENVVAAAGVSFRMREDEIRRLIEEAGFRPQRRTMEYAKAE